MQNRPGNPQVGGGYTQPGFHPPWPPTNWGPPGQPPMQQPGYGYMQAGAYPGPPPQYNMSQGSHSGYPPPPQSSGGYPSGCCQTSARANPQSMTSGGYDYYGQPPPSNYNPQGSYGGKSNYSQPPFGQLQGYGYGGGYNVPVPQPGYGQPQSNRQSVYDHQGHGSAPTYGNPSQDGAPPSYGGQAGSDPGRSACCCSCSRCFH